MGSSYQDLCNFPIDARRQAGFQLDKVQRGLMPDDWKPLTGIAAGVQEVRIRERSGAFRVIYLVNLGNDVYVLHAFQKKSQTTPKKDLDLAATRLRAVKAMLNKGNNSD